MPDGTDLERIRLVLNVRHGLGWLLPWMTAWTLFLFIVLASANALALPDGRGYELVSPTPEQTGGGIGGVFPLGELVLSAGQAGRPLQSATDGSGITYGGEDFYHPQLGSLNQYISQHRSDGWLTENLTPAIPSVRESSTGVNQHILFSPDLAKSVLESEQGSPLVPGSGAPEGYANLYLMQDKQLQPLLTTRPPNRSETTFGHVFSLNENPHFTLGLLFAGANVGSGSLDSFTHIIFGANDALTSATATAPAAVDGGELEDNLYEWFDGHLRLVNVLPDGTTHPGASFGIEYGDDYDGTFLPNLSHVISADGSRVFWTDENTGNLYVRENGETTIQIDASIGGGGSFQTASLDGSEVFFTKAGHLYQYDLSRRTTSDLADGAVKGLVGTSADASMVYFVDTRVLGEKTGPVANRPNLYLEHDGKITFIATLSGADDETPALIGTNNPYGDWYRTFAGRTAEVSPEGRFLAFVSLKPLTGYNNNVEDDSFPRYEIFLYDADTGKLACASCNVDGSRPTSNSLLPAPLGGIYQQRYLEDSGRLFFSTEDDVVPQDTNGRMDLYEYEDGKVYLISPGNNDDEAVFADASENGNDVFFTTEQSLLSSMQSEISALYDARVGALPVESSAPLQCSSEACHAGPAPPPSVAPPPSAIFNGAGNLTPPSSPASNTVRVVSLTRAKRLTRALHACSKRPAKLRAACVKQAQKKYGRVKKTPK